MRRIDHVVVAVSDLDRAAEFYRQLGFQVGTRNRHPWGTENRLVQFASSFIELITYDGDGSDVPPHDDDNFSFGAFVRDYLKMREGFAMLCLDSADAEADAASFRQRGLGAFAPFFFERKGRRPDGTETHVAFTLAFARDEQAPEAAFFVCQQHVPEQFWNAALQRHANGAVGLSGVTLAASEPEAHAAFLSSFCGVSSTLGPRGVCLELDSGRINIEREPDRAPRLASFTVRVPDIARQAESLDAAGIPFTTAATCLMVPPSAAFGVGIVFEQAAA